MRTWRGGRVLAGIAAATALIIAPAACVGADDSGSSHSRQNAAEPEQSEDGSVAPERRESGHNGKRSDANRRDDADPQKTTDRASNNDEVEKPDRPRGRLFTVAEVVDGDTVHLDKPGETSVRIIGIETPETVHPSEPVECGGPVASKAAERLLAGRQVRLVHDPSQGRTDSYGRLLGYIDVPGAGDYGLMMIERGYAAEYTYDVAYRRQPRYQAAERRARDGAAGVWGRCGGVDTPLEQPTTEPETQAPPTTESGTGCAAGYSPCVPSYPPDLDCVDVDGPITITGDDPHGFDADGDGIGCDS